MPAPVLEPQLGSRDEMKLSLSCNELTRTVVRAECVRAESLLTPGMWARVIYELFRQMGFGEKLHLGDTSGAPPFWFLPADNLSLLLHLRLEGRRSRKNHLVARVGSMRDAEVDPGAMHRSLADFWGEGCTWTPRRDALLFRTDPPSSSLPLPLPPPQRTRPRRLSWQLSLTGETARPPASAPAAGGGCGGAAAPAAARTA